MFGLPGLGGLFGGDLLLPILIGFFLTLNQFIRAAFPDIFGQSAM